MCLFVLTDSPILSVPEVFSGFQSQPLTINISVDANPPQLNVTWLINGSRLIPSGNMTVEGSVLTFDNLTLFDVANYTILVDNGIGNETSATFQLKAYGE